MEDLSDEVETYSLDVPLTSDVVVLVGKAQLMLDNKKRIVKSVYVGVKL